VTRAALAGAATGTMVETLALDDPRWMRLVEADPSATLFHHPAWSAATAETYGYRPFVLGVPDGAGGLASGLPAMEVRTPLRGRRWVALPFTDHCPPLGAPPAGHAGALEAARTAARAVRLDVHADVPGPPGHAAGGGAVRHVLELQEDAEAVRRTFHKSQVQRGIKKAAKSGVTVRRADRASDLTEIYYRLHLGTRRRLGVPTQPRRFFERVWAHVMEPALGYTLIAEVDGAPVAGAVYLAWNETVIYKFGASDASSWGLRPNHAIFWEAIRSSCESGYRRFDFGRSDAEDTGLREFKSSWGAEELPLPYTVFASEAPAHGGGRAARAMAPVLRRGPAWLGRAVGALLYRYAA
jgi:CelD/BcsL family acetyltransferase involved in cellulose biosynthesis